MRAPCSSPPLASGASNQHPSPTPQHPSSSHVPSYDATSTPGSWTDRATLGGRPLGRPRADPDPRCTQHPDSPAGIGAVLDVQDRVAIPPLSRQRWSSASSCKNMLVCE
jgi:hypothetical protein